MRASGQAVDFVIRMLDVSITQPELEKSLGVTLDRYEASRETSLRYAQVSMPHGDSDWASVAKFLAEVGPAINKLIQKRVIGSAAMDVVLYFGDNMATVSSSIPARVAELAGQNLIDIEVSVYLTRSD